MGTALATCSRRVAAALLLLAFASPGAAAAGPGAEIPCHASEAAVTAQKLDLTVGQSRILLYDAPVKNVAVANPGVADVLVLSPRQIYLLGKQAGRTSLTLICEHGTITLFELTVAPDVALLKEKLHELFPAEEGLKVITAGEGIVLTGVVSSPPALSQVLTIAEPYAPGKVVNLMEVGGVQQVMLEVRVAEMSRDTARKLGINLAAIAGSGGKIGLSMLNGIMGGAIEKDGTLSLTNNSANAVYQFNSGGNNWTLFLDALKSNGLVNVLAEPNLIAISGQRASFLAGGEFPYETVSAEGLPAISWKKFGVELYFTPTVLSGGRIGIAVNPKVSTIGELVSVAGKLSPKLLAREVSTTIELADGQSFAIAGLLQHDIREAVSKYPLLGDVPILGALFRSSQFQKNETELIIVATPHLVRPLNVADQPLPGDSFVEPDDFEFYLKGSLEAKPPRAAGSPEPRVRVRGGLDGEFGHIVPE
jgi:pilus assembly protein CpaC